MATSSNDNPHKGHRLRLRKQYRKNGIESLLPHQCLELLLFYSIPRSDTNAIAHNLLDTFGSLSGVFNASFEELKTVEGVGDNTATLIKFIPQLYSEYASSVYSAAALGNQEEMCKFFISQFYGLNVEVLRIACLDDNMKIKSNMKLATGSGDSVEFDIRKIVDVVLHSGCSKCIIAHNHPHNDSAPSQEDIRFTNELKDILASMGITLVEHVIVGNDGARSIINNYIWITPSPKTKSKQR